MLTSQQPQYLRLAVILLVTLSATAATAQRSAGVGSHNHSQSNGWVLTLPRNLEMRLAVNALPKPLRDGATVLVLEPEGYIKANQGTNPFTCFVSHRGGNFYPVCFDEEGARTILPAFADDAVLRLEGAGDEEVERTIAKGFEEGRYRPPARPGIAYMLSPATYMLEDGKLARSFPHTMFYAPFLTDLDIGGLMGRTAFVDRPGPHGMIIVSRGKRNARPCSPNRKRWSTKWRGRLGSSRLIPCRVLKDSPSAYLTAARRALAVEPVKALAAQ